MAPMASTRLDLHLKGFNVLHVVTTSLGSARPQVLAFILLAARDQTPGILIKSEKTSQLSDTFWLRLKSKGNSERFSVPILLYALVLAGIGQVIFFFFITLKPRVE